MSAATARFGSFSAEEIAERRTSLGASEVAAAIGKNAKMSRVALYLEKIGEGVPFEGNQFTEWGLRLEDSIALKYAHMHPDWLTQKPSPRMFRHPTEPWMTCSPDRLILVDGTLSHGLECKNVTIWLEDHWGDAGTDQIPVHFLIQCIWSMIVTGLRRWDLAVLLGGNDYREYQIVWDQELADMIVAAARTFWFDHVQQRVMPTLDGSESTTEWLKRRFRAHDALMLEGIPEYYELGQRYAKLTIDIKKLETEKAAVANVLRMVIGDHAGIEGNGWKITWTRSENGRVSWKDVAEAMRAPQKVIDEHTTESSRTLNVRMGAKK